MAQTKAYVQGFIIGCLSVVLIAMLVICSHETPTEKIEFTTLYVHGNTSRFKFNDFVTIDPTVKDSVRYSVPSDTIYYRNRMGVVIVADKDSGVIRVLRER